MDHSDKTIRYIKQLTSNINQSNNDKSNEDNNNIIKGKLFEKK